MTNLLFKRWGNKRWFIRFWIFSFSKFLGKKNNFRKFVWPFKVKTKRETDRETKTKKAANRKRQKVNFFGWERKKCLSESLAQEFLPPDTQVMLHKVNLNVFSKKSFCNAFLPRESMIQIMSVISVAAHTDFSDKLYREWLMLDASTGWISLKCKWILMTRLILCK